MRKYIKNIKVGDKVKVFNLKTNKQEVSTVSQAFSATSNHYYLLNGKTKVTGEHPYFVEGGWKRVKNLKIGDKLLHKNGKKVKVKTLKKFDKPMTIYNIEVEGEHNYYADGLLVHNKHGRYYGQDKPAENDQDAYNAMGNTFNSEGVGSDTAGLAVLEAQGKAAIEADAAVGAAETFTNENSQEIAPPTGLHVDLAAKVKAALDQKTTARLAVGEVHDEAWKELGNTLQATGAATVGERYEMDTQRDLEIGMIEAQDESDKAIRDANKEFEDERDRLYTDLEKDLRESALTVHENWKKINSDMKSKWSRNAWNSGGTVENATMWNASKYVADREAKPDKRPGTPDRVRRGSGLIFNINDPEGTLQDTSAYRSPKLATEKQSAFQWYAPVSAGQDNLAKSVNMMNDLNMEHKLIRGTRFPEEGSEGEQRIANAYEAAGDTAFAVAGSSSYSTMFGGTNDNEYYVERQSSNRCFHGNTWIEVVK